MTHCKQCQGYKNRDGYGVVRRNGRLYLAHRLAWEDVFGIIPEGMCVCHKCDNPACINVDHLFLGTQKDNMLDSVNKGRCTILLGLKGEKHPRAKLTEAAVRFIRSSDLTRRALARMFGVAKSQIDFVVHRRTWAHVT
jgi:hypothetical protein